MVPYVEFRNDVVNNALNVHEDFLARYDISDDMFRLVSKFNLKTFQKLSCRSFSHKKISVLIQNFKFFSQIFQKPVKKLIFF